MLSIKLYIRSNSAKVGPPLSTILGNFGINVTKFSKEFNDYTVALPNYFYLPVVITIKQNRAYTFFIKNMTIGHLLKLIKRVSFLSYKKFTSNSTLRANIMYLYFIDFIKLFKFIYKNNLNEEKFKQFCSILSSHNVLILNKT